MAEVTRWIQANHLGRGEKTQRRMAEVTRRTQANHLGRGEKGAAAHG